METLINISQNILKQSDNKFVRYLMPKINWSMFIADIEENTGTLSDEIADSSVRRILFMFFREKT
jgi:hypothetical protein